jgi:large subunit ribosomal protein L4
MPATELKDINNKVKGSVNLPEELFGLSARNDILHESVKNSLANRRQGTHATKTKGLVSGGGKKPWKQKHTGRARSGSIRSPLWRGGGTIFGPQPRDYSYALPKNVRKRALGEALSAKLSSGELTIVDAISIAKPRTKDMVGILRGLGLEGKSVLVVVPEKDENIMLSARNIPGVNVARVMDLNAYDVLRHGTLLITKSALDLMTSAVPERGSEL